MNLFLLSLNLLECARFHCDSHVVKIILEAAQMLYTAWALLQNTDEWRLLAPEGSYKKTHPNHPMSVWVRENSSNYIFACEYAMALCEEYTRRYNKIHKTQEHIEWLADHLPPSIPDEPITVMPQCMPDEYKVNEKGSMEDSVVAYRNYYRFKATAIKVRYAHDTEWPQFMEDLQ